MVMPYRQVDVESALQRIFKKWQEHPIDIQWVESLEWSAQSRRRARVGCVYPHGVQFLLQGECGDGPIAYWLSWIELGLNPALIGTAELRDAVVSAMAHPPASVWAEPFADSPW